MVSLAGLLGALFIVGASIADQVYLEADFNDKEINAPIGNGGPTIGEPIQIDDAHITAIVRDGPMGSPSLEIGDIGDTYPGWTRFGFLDGEELTEGVVNISADLWFHLLSDGFGFNFSIGGIESTQPNFASLYFYPNGDIHLYKQEGHFGVIGTYETGKIYRVILEYDMDAGTYDVWLDNQLALEAESHGITESGIGSINVGATYDDDTDGYFNIDVIRVTDYFQATSSEEHSWGRIKARFR